MTKLGNVVSKTTVQHVTQDDLLKDGVKQQVQKYDNAINNRLKDANFVNSENAPYYLVDDETDPAYGDGSNTPSDAEYGNMTSRPEQPEQDDINNKTYNKYVGAEVEIDKGGELRRGRVTCQVRDNNGVPRGRYNRNPFLDLREYEIEYADGTTDCYMNKII